MVDVYVLCQACTRGYPQVKINNPNLPYCRRCVLEAFKFTKVVLHGDSDVVSDSGDSVAPTNGPPPLTLGLIGV